MKVSRYKVGDIVALKSGSPRMTIQKVTGPWLDVVWVAFNSGTPQYAKLHCDAVKQRMYPDER